MAYQDLLLKSAERLCQQVATTVNAPFSVRLWDGSVHPLGKDADPELCISIRDPGVVGALLRRPTGANIIRHFARGDLDFHGADFATFAERARIRNSRKKARGLSRWELIRNLAPFLFARSAPPPADHEWQGDETGRRRVQQQNRDYIQFHYDIGNEFYELFLDPRMVYTCAYYTDWNNSLEQAQFDKMDMVCRKLRLEPGDRFLDIGCGWGALVIHAAQHYGVEAVGVTLSSAQVDYARRRIRELGLEDRVRVELQDYMDVRETFDKVASVGMVEHVGIANIPKYTQKIASLIRDRGLFLNHGITRPAKASRKKFMRIRPEQRLMARFIFPGGELGHLGHSIECLEASGFRVHDVEGWRDHYARTCAQWCRNLWDHRERAEELVGRERFRLWLAYLGCISLPFSDGSLCLFQTVSTRHVRRGPTGLPPTREYLYDTPQERIPGGPHQPRSRQIAGLSGNHRVDP